ncbi:MAG: hypothetical protein HC936_17460, partial [Leptolyngbyaceae cyanobacterium SU_3_3]|nr:hypothetical protein [Leptolyngbyaceae cyanobacterium SU_3_3]
MRTSFLLSMWLRNAPALAQKVLVALAAVTVLLSGSLALPQAASAYPIFAQQQYETPREATGRIVCANCHLGAKPTEVEVPQSVLPDTVFEAVVKIPYDKSVQQVTGDGSKGPLNVGAVLMLPEGFKLFIEHKLYEPAFYSTVIADWGTSYHCVRELGERAFSLVDLGHHAPNVNIEMIVARLIQFGKLGGFHFNDSKYGDDDLDSGSIKPFQLFLVFNELVDAELSSLSDFDPAYMLDQSHNVTDPVESLMMSAAEVVRAYVQAHLVDRARLAEHQSRND